MRAATDFLVFLMLESVSFESMNFKFIYFLLRTFLRFWYIQPRLPATVRKVTVKANNREILSFVPSPERFSFQPLFLFSTVYRFRPITNDISMTDLQVAYL